MINLVLFGPPGAGKGTQSEKLKEKYALTHISTGDLFRKHLSENTELGNLAKSYMEAGNLVPDEVVIGMAQDKIKEHLDGNGFILDGFPRTEEQAQALDSMLKLEGLKVDIVLSLEVDEDELKARLKKRALVSGRPDDQDEQKIEKRIRVYKDETLAVLNYYESRVNCVKVNGVGSIDNIFGELIKAIDAI